MKPLNAPTSPSNQLIQITIRPPHKSLSITTTDHFSATVQSVPPLRHHLQSLFTVQCRRDLMEDSRSSKYGAMEIAPPGFEAEGEGKVINGRAETLLRLVPMGLCVSALVIMLKNSQSNDYGSVSYSDLGAFRYLVHANGICAGYSLLSAIIVAMPRPASTMSRAWTFFFLDQVLTYVALAAGAVSAEVLYLAYNGDTSTTWSEACSSFNGFCKKATASVAITLAAVAFFAALSLISSYKLFSRFDAPALPPPSCNGKGGIEAPDGFQG